MKRGRFNWHNLLMFVCVIPIMLVIIGQLNNSSLLKNINAGSLLPLGMLLICPLMHLFMMRGMNHGNSCHEEENKVNKNDSLQTGK